MTKTTYHCHLLWVTDRVHNLLSLISNKVTQQKFSQLQNCCKGSHGFLVNIQNVVFWCCAPEIPHSRGTVCANRWKDCSLQFRKSWFLSLLRVWVMLLLETAHWDESRRRKDHSNKALSCILFNDHIILKSPGKHAANFSNRIWF